MDSYSQEEGTLFRSGPSSEDYGGKVVESSKYVPALENKTLLAKGTVETDAQDGPDLFDGTDDVSSHEITFHRRTDSTQVDDSC